MYFVEDGFLKAVVSIGDLFKFLEGRKQRIWNTDFTYCYYYKLFRRRGNFFRIADKDKSPKWRGNRYYKLTWQ